MWTLFWSSSSWPDSLLEIAAIFAAAVRLPLLLLSSFGPRSDSIVEICAVFAAAVWLLLVEQGNLLLLLLSSGP